MVDSYSFLSFKQRTSLLYQDSFILVSLVKNLEKNILKSVIGCVANIWALLLLLFFNVILELLTAVYVEKMGKEKKKNHSNLVNA